MQTITTPASHRGLRFVARDSEDTRAALLYWLGAASPAREASCFEATQRFLPLVQVVFPDERPGAFVNPFAVREVLRHGCVERLVFLDDSWLDIWSGGNCTDLCNLYSSWRHQCR